MSRCKKCGTIFSAIGNLVRHEQEMHNSPRHSCPCDKTFRRKYLMNRHISSGKCIQTGITQIAPERPLESSNQLGLGVKSILKCHLPSPSPYPSKKRILAEQDTSSEETEESSSDGVKSTMKRHLPSPSPYPRKKRILADQYTSSEEETEDSGSDEGNYVDNPTSVEDSGEESENDTSEELENGSNAELEENSSEDESERATRLVHMFWETSEYPTRLGWWSWGDKKPLVEKHIYFLVKFIKGHSKKRKEMLEGASYSQLDAIGEIADNLVNGYVPLPDTYWKKIRKSRTIIRKLASNTCGYEEKRGLLLAFPKLVILMLTRIHEIDRKLHDIFETSEEE